MAQLRLTPRCRRFVVPLIACLVLVTILHMYLSSQTPEVPQTNMAVDASLEYLNSQKLIGIPLADPFDSNGVFHSRHSDMYHLKPDSEGKIDWQDYIMSAREKLRSGDGEQGKAVRIKPAEKEKAAEIYALNGFAGFASDKMSLARSVADLRHRQCIGKKYSAQLPSVSIVVPFYEEHWSTLLRTTISTLNRAPPHLIKEVILVDDGSTHKPFLQKKLDDYLAKTFPTGLVRVVRNKEREGLIRARLLGAKNASGDVIIFLDSHVEAGVNWLPPLLDPIQRDYRTVTCPFIDVLGMEDFEVRAQDEGGRGAWAWNFDYKRLPRLPGDANHPAEPFDSPVMAGGLFAISRRWFWELGGYDPGLFIWGGEQYELSFKIWMCGGRMVDVPCSRIAHAYRSSFPFPNNRPSALEVNYKRVAEVWLDEYKEALYYRRPQLKNIDAGDISKQLAIRNKLQCKPFSWFMKNVAFDQMQRYPTKDPLVALEGKVSSVADPKLCLSNSPSSLFVTSCEQANPFKYTFKGEIRSGIYCAEHHPLNSPITMYRCHGYYNNQAFHVHFDKKANSNPIRISQTNDAECFSLDPKTRKLTFASCDASSVGQQWNWENVDYEKAAAQWKEWNLLPV